MAGRIGAFHRTLTKTLLWVWLLNVNVLTSNAALTVSFPFHRHLFSFSSSELAFSLRAEFRVQVSARTKREMGQVLPFWPLIAGLSILMPLPEAAGSVS